MIDYCPFIDDLCLFLFTIGYYSSIVCLFSTIFIVFRPYAIRIVFPYYRLGIGLIGSSRPIIILIDIRVENIA
jgi:hypothetical protein